MTNPEFDQWVKDFRVRFPDTAAWMKQLPQETLEIWRDEFFSQFELRDALAANCSLMSDPDFQFTKRERIPAVMSKRMQEIRFTRDDRFRKAQERKTHRAVSDNRLPGMAACFRQLLVAKRTDPDFDSKAFVESYFEE